MTSFLRENPRNKEYINFRIKAFVHAGVWHKEGYIAALNGNRYYLSGLIEDKAAWWSTTTLNSGSRMSWFVQENQSKNLNVRLKELNFKELFDLLPNSLTLREDNGEFILEDQYEEELYRCDENTLLSAFLSDAFKTYKDLIVKIVTEDI